MVHMYHSTLVVDLVLSDHRPTQNNICRVFVCNKACLFVVDRDLKGPT